MKILFVASSNRGNISPIVVNQGKSLLKNNIEVSYFGIVGKGLWGYLQNVKKCRKFIKENNFDLIHAHYSFSGFVAALTFSGIPLVVSLMGSDVEARKWFRVVIHFFARWFWDEVIVKSESMHQTIRLKNSHVIPNGVDIAKFYPKSKSEAREKLSIRSDQKLIIWVSDPRRYEKNYPLAEESVKALADKSVRLLPLFRLDQSVLNDYYNAADLLLLTSRWEGSPNVIKEAMACNCPIVSTDVGDVRMIVGDTKGCYISTFDIKDIAEKIKLALNFALMEGRTNGRNKIIKSGLDSETIALRLLKVYKTVLGNDK